MSLNYAAALSKYPDKGVLGLQEIYETDEKVKEKAVIIASLIKESKRIVFLTGAGISTSIGIPDFRGPNGVWTLEEMGLKPEVNIDFENASPSFTHQAIVAILESGKICYIASQNVDNLHMKSGYPKDSLSEVHGNIFTERCLTCGREYLRGTPTRTIGMKKTGNLCTTVKPNSRRCRGKLVDTVLDWEDSLPWDELAECEYQCSVADLCIVLGTSLQIQPTGNMPFKTRRYGGKIAIVNLQKTRMDQHCDVVIHAKCDDVMRIIISELGIEVKARSIDLPAAGLLKIIKDSFRRDPPPIAKFRVKRVKVSHNGTVTKTEEEFHDNTNPENSKSCAQNDEANSCGSQDNNKGLLCDNTDFKTEEAAV